MTGPAPDAADVAPPWNGRRVILDSCALLNLYSTRRIDEILDTFPQPCMVADLVRDREALWVGRHRSGPAADYEPVDIGPLVSAGLIQVLSLKGDDEFAHFVALAASIDDGEAMSGALAHVRQLVVATDDRAAIAAFARYTSPIATCGTASLLRHWTQCARIDAGTLRAALLDIRERACFEPGVRDPLYRWWQDALATG